MSWFSFGQNNNPNPDEVKREQFLMKNKEPLQRLQNTKDIREAVNIRRQLIRDINSFVSDLRGSKATDNVDIDEIETQLMFNVHYLFRQWINDMYYTTSVVEIAAFDCAIDIKERLESYVLQADTLDKDFDSSFELYKQELKNNVSNDIEKWSQLYVEDNTERIKEKFRVEKNVKLLLEIIEDIYKEELLQIQARNREIIQFNNEVAQGVIGFQNANTLQQVEEINRRRLILRATRTRLIEAYPESQKQLKNFVEFDSSKKLAEARINAIQEFIDLVEVSIADFGKADSLNKLQEIYERRSSLEVTRRKLVTAYPKSQIMDFKEFDSSKKQAEARIDAIKEFIDLVEASIADFGKADSLNKLQEIYERRSRLEVTRRKLVTDYPKSQIMDFKEFDNSKKQAEERINATQEFIDLVEASIADFGKADSLNKLQEIYERRSSLEVTRRKLVTDYPKSQIMDFKEFDNSKKQAEEKIDAIRSFNRLARETSEKLSGSNTTIAELRDIDVNMLVARRAEILSTYPKANIHGDLTEVDSFGALKEQAIKDKKRENSEAFVREFRDSNRVLAGFRNATINNILDLEVKLSPEKENAITVARQQASELNIADVESAINQIVQEAIESKQGIIAEAKARELVLSKEIAGVLFDNVIEGCGTEQDCLDKVTTAITAGAGLFWGRKELQGLSEENIKAAIRTQLKITDNEAITGFYNRYLEEIANGYYELLQNKQTFLQKEVKAIEDKNKKQEAEKLALEAKAREEAKTQEAARLALEQAKAQEEAAKRQKAQQEEEARLIKKEKEEIIGVVTNFNKSAEEIRQQLTNKEASIKELSEIEVQELVVKREEILSKYSKANIQGNLTEVASFGVLKEQAIKDKKRENSETFINAFKNGNRVLAEFSNAAVNNILDLEGKLSAEKENAITVVRQQASELNIADVELAINQIVQEAIESKQGIIAEAKARELVLSKEIAGVLFDNVIEGCGKEQDCLDKVTKTIKAGAGWLWGRQELQDLSEENIKGAIGAQLKITDNEAITGFYNRQSVQIANEYHRLLQGKQTSLQAEVKTIKDKKQEEERLALEQAKAQEAAERQKAQQEEEARLKKEQAIKDRKCENSEAFVREFSNGNRVLAEFRDATINNILDLEGKLQAEKENAITSARQKASELNIADVELAINKIVKEVIEGQQVIAEQAKARELVLSKEIAGVLFNGVIEDCGTEQDCLDKVTIAITAGAGWFLWSDRQTLQGLSAQNIKEAIIKRLDKKIDHEAIAGFCNRNSPQIANEYYVLLRRTQKSLNSKTEEIQKIIDKLSTATKAVAKSDSLEVVNNLEKSNTAENLVKGVQYTGVDGKTPTALSVKDLESNKEYQTKVTEFTQAITGKKEQITKANNLRLSQDSKSAVIAEIVAKLTAATKAVAESDSLDEINKLENANIAESLVKGVQYTGVDGKTPTALSVKDLESNKEYQTKVTEFTQAVTGKKEQITTATNLRLSQDSKSGVIAEIVAKLTAAKQAVTKSDSLEGVNNLEKANTAESLVKGVQYTGVDGKTPTALLVKDLESNEGYKSTIKEFTQAVTGKKEQITKANNLRLSQDSKSAIIAEIVDKLTAATKAVAKSDSLDEINKLEKANTAESLVKGVQYTGVDGKTPTALSVKDLESNEGYQAKIKEFTQAVTGKKEQITKANNLRLSQDSKSGIIAEIVDKLTAATKAVAESDSLEGVNNLEKANTAENLVKGVQYTGVDGKTPTALSVKDLESNKEYKSTIKEFTQAITDKRADITKATKATEEQAQKDAEEKLKKEQEQQIIAAATKTIQQAIADRDNFSASSEIIALKENLNLDKIKALRDAAEAKRDAILAKLPEDALWLSGYSWRKYAPLVDTEVKAKMDAIIVEAESTSTTTIQAIVDKDQFVTSIEITLLKDNRDPNKTKILKLAVEAKRDVILRKLPKQQKDAAESSMNQAIVEAETASSNIQQAIADRDNFATGVEVTALLNNRDPSKNIEFKLTAEAKRDEILARLPEDALWLSSYNWRKYAAPFVETEVKTEMDKIIAEAATISKDIQQVIADRDNFAVSAEVVALRDNMDPNNIVALREEAEAKRDEILAKLPADALWLSRYTWRKFLPFVDTEVKIAIDRIIAEAETTSKIRQQAIEDKNNFAISAEVKALRENIDPNKNREFKLAAATKIDEIVEKLPKQQKTAARTRMTTAISEAVIISTTVQQAIKDKNNFASSLEVKALRENMDLNKNTEFKAAAEAKRDEILKKLPEQQKDVAESSMNQAIFEAEFISKTKQQAIVDRDNFAASAEVKALRGNMDPSKTVDLKAAAEAKMDEILTKLPKDALWLSKYTWRRFLPFVDTEAKTNMVKSIVEAETTSKNIQHAMQPEKLFKPVANNMPKEEQIPHVTAEKKDNIHPDISANSEKQSRYKTFKMEQLAEKAIKETQFIQKYLQDPISFFIEYSHLPKEKVDKLFDDLQQQANQLFKFIIELQPQIEGQSNNENQDWLKEKFEELNKLLKQIDSIFKEKMHLLDNKPNTNVPSETDNMHDDPDSSAQADKSKTVLENFLSLEKDATSFNYIRFFKRICKEIKHYSYDYIIKQIMLYYYYDNPKNNKLTELQKLLPLKNTKIIIDNMLEQEEITKLNKELGDIINFYLSSLEQRSLKQFKFVVPLAIYDELENLLQDKEQAEDYILAQQMSVPTRFVIDFIHQFNTKEASIANKYNKATIKQYLQQISLIDGDISKKIFAKLLANTANNKERLKITKDLLLKMGERLQDNLIVIPDAVVTAFKELGYSDILITEQNKGDDNVINPKYTNIVVALKKLLKSEQEKLDLIKTRAQELVNENNHTLDNQYTDPVEQQIFEEFYLDAREKKTQEDLLKEKAQKTINELKELKETAADNAADHNKDQPAFSKPTINHQQDKGKEKQSEQRNKIQMILDEIKESKDPNGLLHNINQAEAIIQQEKINLTDEDKTLISATLRDAGMRVYHELYANSTPELYNQKIMSLRFSCSVPIYKSKLFFNVNDSEQFANELRLLTTNASIKLRAERGG